MIPIHNDAGEVVAFSGRLLDPEAKAQKYVNSPETPIFIKSRILFGLNKTKRADHRGGQRDLVRGADRSDALLAKGHAQRRRAAGHGVHR